MKIKKKNWKGWDKKELKRIGFFKIENKEEQQNFNKEYVEN